MRVYQMIIDYLEFRKFDKKVKQTFQHIPSIERYRDLVMHDWSSIGKAQIKANKSTIKQILPLKSLVFEEDYGYGKFIKFSAREFNEVMYCTINRKLHRFLIDYYVDKDMETRITLYNNSKDTFTLLLDAISENYHLENEGEITELIEFLKKEFCEVLTRCSKSSDIKQRMEIELEYIKRRKENEKFDFN